MRIQPFLVGASYSRYLAGRTWSSLRGRRWDGVVRFGAVWVGVGVERIL